MRKNLTSNPCVPDLYALYASKNRLCMLCENTTPELTAYNAYRNANRRVRRAEGLKMYAVGNAYRLHTKCIQAYKKSKREILPSTSSLYCLFSHPLLSAISGIHLFTACVFEHSRIPSRLIACSFFLGRAAATLGGRSFERYMRIAYPHGKQNYHGRHHHRPPHSACGLRKHRGGVR